MPGSVWAGLACKAMHPCKICAIARGFSVAKSSLEVPSPMEPLSY
jgi:hypothetical protein